MSNGTRVIFFGVRFHRGDERPTRPRSPLMTHTKSDRGLVSPPGRRSMKGHGWRRPLENVISSQLDAKRARSPHGATAAFAEFPTFLTAALSCSGETPNF